MPEVELHQTGRPLYRRMVRFDWSDTTLHWVPDDPFSTHMINVLHLLLPEGERHFGSRRSGSPMVRSSRPILSSSAWA